MLIVSATELQNNFGKYLAKVIEGEELIIMKNGKEVARMTPKDQVKKSLVDSLIGILGNDVEVDENDVWDEKIKDYESDD